MSRIGQLAVMVVLGLVFWTIFLSIWSGEFYAPIPDMSAPPGLPQPGLSEWVGAALAFIGLYLIPGLPIFVGLKQLHKRSQRFRKIVEKLA